MNIVGQTYEDYSGRKLHVTEHRPGDPAGREIVGALYLEDDGYPWHYATSAAIFQEVWINRVPATSYEQQERNRRKLGV